MGRASVTLGEPDFGSGIMDRSATRGSWGNTGYRDSSCGVDPAGQVLSRPAESEPTHSQQGSHESHDEVACHVLWFQLSHEQQMQFGSCFSRILLKCLSGTEQEEEIEQ